MHKIDEIFFSGRSIKSFGPSDILFNPDINWDTDVQNVYVTYFTLKENKIIGDFTIYKNENLIAVEYCEQKNKINVCYLDEKSQIYFWINSDDVNFAGTFEECWEKNDVRLYVKAIKERWTTEKNIKKE